MESVIIVGGFIEIIELCQEQDISIIGIFDNFHKLEMYSYDILGNDLDAKKMSNKYNKHPLIITPDSPAIRRKLKNDYQNFGYHFTTLISNHAKISKSVQIGIGSIIQNFAHISSKVKLGIFVKINCMVNIMHNSTVGDFTTVAPNAVVLGHVTIGENCYIGSNATILPRITICDNVVIGAGAVVTKDIEDSGSVYAGVPAVKIK